MNVLVDTSVWSAHFRQADARLIALLHAGRVLCHPWVVGEIACGTPPAPRSVTLQLFKALELSHTATLEDVAVFIEAHRLYGRGCGLIDLSLLASVCITPETVLWTLDLRLQALAVGLGKAYVPPLHS